MSDLLLAEQAWWDPRRFDPEFGYAKLDERDQKTRHILLHSVKAAGKLALGDPSKIMFEVIPDLAIYRSQLVNTFDLNTSVMTIYAETTMSEDERESGVPELYTRVARTGLNVANYRLAEYIEPREHGIVTDPGLILDATTQLHIAASRLALAYEVDLEKVHRLRMEEILGEPFADPLV